MSSKICFVRPVALDVGGGEPQRLQRWPACCASSFHWASDVPSSNGRPQVGVGHEDLEPAAAQVQLVDDHWIEQAHDVRAGAHDVPGVGERALEGARTAQTLAALQHEDGPAGSGQVGRAGQAVVAAADDHRVPRAERQLAMGAGSPTSPRASAIDPITSLPVHVPSRPYRHRRRGQPGGAPGEVGSGSLRGLFARELPYRLTSRDTTVTRKSCPSSAWNETIALPPYVGGREISEAERGQHHEAEVEEVRQGRVVSLDEERVAVDAADAERQQPKINPNST